LRHVLSSERRLIYPNDSFGIHICTQIYNKYKINLKNVNFGFKTLRHGFV
jgi:hypothetical protein